MAVIRMKSASGIPEALENSFGKVDIMKFDIGDLSDAKDAGEILRRHLAHGKPEALKEVRSNESTAIFELTDVFGNVKTIVVEL